MFIAALALFIYGFNFLKGKDIFKKERHFYSVYPGVGGLVVASPVFINGLKVGLVKDIRFHPDASNRVVVEFALTNPISIPSNSVARIYSSDLMGSKAIDLILGNSTTMASSGDTLSSQLQATLQEEVNRQVLPLKTKAEALMGSIDSAITIIRYVFNETTRENLDKSFLSIKTTIENLEHTTFNIDTLVTSQRYRMSLIIANIESITTNIRNNNQQISNVLENFSRITDTLARIQLSSTFEQLNTTLTRTAEVMTKIESGQGSLGLLINDDSLYQELTKSSQELELLLQDMRLHPDRYLHFSVFGRNPKKNQYTPPAGK